MNSRSKFSRWILLNLGVMKHIFVSILAGLPKEIAQVVESDATGRPLSIILFSLLNILLPITWQSVFSMKKSADTIMWCLLKRFKSFAKSLTCKIVKKSKADRWNLLLLTSQIMLGKNGEQVQLTWHILGTMFVTSEFNHHVRCLGQAAQRELL